jgi:hypothetical protein
VSPGAVLTRTTGATQQEAEDKAIAHATDFLRPTKPKDDLRR